MRAGKQTGQYDSYLLRIWRGGQEGEWRWMLQNIRTGEQRGFRDMDALVQFLTSIQSEPQVTLPDLTFPE